MVLSQSNIAVDPGTEYVSFNVNVIGVLFVNPWGLRVTVDPLPPKIPRLAVRVCEVPRAFVNCCGPPFSHRLFGIFNAVISGVGPKTRITVEESVPSERMIVYASTPEIVGVKV